MSRTLAALLALLCATFGAPVRAQETPPARREDGGQAPETGPLSEEEFKALHTLRQDGNPVLRGESVKVGEDTCYLSKPANAAPGGPAVVVIHEWWGLNENVKHWADRLAAEGYTALAVDLYGGKVGTTPDEAMGLMKAVDPAVAVRRLKAAAAYLRETPAIKAGRLGSIGWCFGGAQSLALAQNDADLACAVVYYGGNPPQDAKAVEAVKAKVICIYGSKDRSIPPERVAAFDKALTDAKVEHEVHSYDADHAFANPSNPRYQSEAAADAWAKVKAWMARHLKP